MPGLDLLSTKKPRIIKTETPNPFAPVHVKEAIQRRIHKHVDIIRVREKMNPSKTYQLKKRFSELEPALSRGLSTMGKEVCSVKVPKIGLVDLSLAF